MSAQVTVRISATIDNEYANRCPEGCPEHISEGINRLTVDEARWVLQDAEHNSNRDYFDVGPNDMPLGAFNAYRALAKQVRASIAKATGAAQ